MFHLIKEVRICVGTYFIMVVVIRIVSLVYYKYNLYAVDSVKENSIRVY